jgi:hypothetical protein
VQGSLAGRLLHSSEKEVEPIMIIIIVLNVQVVLVTAMVIFFLLKGR